MKIVRRLRKFFLLVVVGFLALSVGLVLLYRWVPPPLTPLMVIRAVGGAGIDKDWRPIDEISPHLVRAVMAAEDTLFCEHYGFDWKAIKSALAENREGGRMLGASTITMQTAKNLFLWQGRTYLRKAFEAYFTVLLEFFWSKRRIVETYVNVIEWGSGIYGAEAAAQAYFGKSADALTRREASLLAAILPNPRRWSASRPTNYIAGRASTIRARMRIMADPEPGPCG